MHEYSKIKFTTTMHAIRNKTVSIFFAVRKKNAGRQPNTPTTIAYLHEKQTM